MRRSELIRLAHKHRKDVLAELAFADGELHANGFYSAVPYRSTVRGHVRRAVRFLKGENVTLTPGAAQQLKLAVRHVLDGLGVAD